MLLPEELNLKHVLYHSWLQPLVPSIFPFLPFTHPRNSISLFFFPFRFCLLMLNAYFKDQFKNQKSPVYSLLWTHLLKASSFSF